MKDVAESIGGIGVNMGQSFARSIDVMPMWKIFHHGKGKVAKILAKVNPSDNKVRKILRSLMRENVINL
ncbi:hypothetical protein E4V51_29755 [Paenibacillus sp. 28ISP30-2]|nr:hypothetical protein [Paenibacillus sp. 28ISP30-2]